MNNKVKTRAIFILGVILCIGVAMMLSSCVGSSSSTTATSTSNSKTCQVCGKTFTDSDNKHSIKMTNMCKQCYSNYEYAMNATGKDVYGNPLY